MTDYSELERRLRALARAEHDDLSIADEAADEIASLKSQLAQTRTILAHTDIGSLPNDWTLEQVAEARIDDLCKLREQVRDTCARAEKAEAQLAQAEGQLINLTANFAAARGMLTTEVEHTANLGAVKSELVNAVNGLLGLLMLVRSRDDISSEVKEALTNSHRIELARAILTKLGEVEQ